MTIRTNGYQTQNPAALRPAQGAYAKQPERAGRFKSEQIQGNDPNARAQAGQAFMNRNPVPDKTQGVMMPLSQTGRNLAEKLTQQSQRIKTVAETKDGRVTQVKAAEKPERQQSEKPESQQSEKPEKTMAEKAKDRQQAQANPAEKREQTIADRLRERLQAKTVEKPERQQSEKARKNRGGEDKRKAAGAGKSGVTAGESA